MNKAKAQVLATTVIAFPVAFVVMLVLYALYAGVLVLCFFAHVYLPEPAGWTFFPVCGISYVVAYRLMRWVLG